MADTRGQLSHASHHLIQGWAQRGADGAPARLEVFLDDVLYHGILADGPPVAEGGAPSFQLHLHLTLGPEPIAVSVRNAEDGAELEGSPMVLAPLINQPSQHYTETTGEWLDGRFGEGAWRDGIYVAHQPIYGFRKLPCEPNWQSRYRVTYQLLQDLNRLDFETLVDIGGAEGYTAALIRETFGCQTMSCDVSGEACRRAQQLFSLESRKVDIHALPFEDGAFDVVLSSETIEHVADCMRAIDELLRVARRAVVITVPHDSIDHVEGIIAAGEMHGHIHHFDVDSFDYLRARGYQVLVRKIVSHAPEILWPGYLMECDPEIVPHIQDDRLRELGTKRPWLARLIYNRFRMARILEDDSAAIKRWPEGGYLGVVAVILKDETCLRAAPRREVRMRDVFNFSVPHLRQDQEPA
ncbi:MAG: class I SAM-dependent methyltransferase [Pseudomonadota bacterium]